MQIGSLAQLYSSKTDDELLLLAADPHSLVEDARLILAEELRRRNLVLQPAPSRVENEHPMPVLWSAGTFRYIRSLSSFLLNLANAVFGTGLLELYLLPYIGHSRSVAEWVARAWLTSVTLAALLGFLTFWRWRPKSALWIWTLPTGVLLFGALMYMNGGRVASDDSVLRHFISPNCIDNRETCRDFLIFTLPAVRSVAYSAAAWLSLRFHNAATKSEIPET